jgi:UDP-GlcNAc:undecaprenyl-phosphate/decaprenyl-phosphate GlcNAc-1-phosphate transferase
MPDLWWPPLAAFLLSVALTYVVRPAARMVGAVATPKEDRWHRGTVPLLGGIAIVGAVLACAALLPPLSGRAWTLLGGASFLAAAGLVDDLRPLGPQVKFLIQLVAASTLVVAGVRLDVTSVAVLDQIITVVWLVGLTNAFNLLDNMDGLAAGIGAIAAGFRCYFFLVDGNIEGAWLAATLCGALAGFLVFNFQPASIFMGDTGSLFLGLMVGGLNVMGPYPYSRGTVAVLLLPVLLLLVPIFDTLFVATARTVAGLPLAQGGRDHTSHRLVSLGMSERGAVLSLWGMAFASGLVAVLSYRYGLPYTVTLVGLLAAGLLVLGVKLGLQRVYPKRPGRTGVVRVVADFQYKKQVATIALDAALVALAYYSAYVLRFEATLESQLPMFSASLLLVLVSHVLALGLFGTYQDSWRHAGIRDLMKLAAAALIGTALAMLVILFQSRFESYSRAVFAIHWVLVTMFLCGSRILFRALGELLIAERSQGPRTVIYGAGAGGVMVLREARSNDDLAWTIIGFIDDDREKFRTNVHGVPVLGNLEQVAPLIMKGQVAQVVISTASVPPERIDALSRLCADSGVRTLVATLTFRDATPPDVRLRR